MNLAGIRRRGLIREALPTDQAQISGCAPFWVSAGSDLAWNIRSGNRFVEFRFLSIICVRSFGIGHSGG